VTVLRFHSTWHKIYENAAVYFCPKMHCTNVHCLTPSHPHKRPVDVKWGKSEYRKSSIKPPLSNKPLLSNKPTLFREGKLLHYKQQKMNFEKLLG